MPGLGPQTASGPARPPNPHWHPVEWRATTFRRAGATLSRNQERRSRERLALLRRLSEEDRETLRVILTKALAATASERADTEAVLESAPPLTRSRPLSVSFRLGQ